ncbi:hypothetical protein Agabi119p4_10717 [Agaricus bisporus var. burnettii]|uniref:Uncharacterized protein n=1 Tax=Agaricus bisporus var. burnettii TaxID=192524 RepID=A0A8H7C345_AGABI|nr:hypothetical protein Agabi119p4_10717 [Agaricus bisporus var. burnettii]
MRPSTPFRLYGDGVAWKGLNVECTRMAKEGGTLLVKTSVRVTEHMLSGFILRFLKDPTQAVFIAFGLTGPVLFEPEKHRNVKKVWMSGAADWASISAHHGLGMLYNSFIFLMRLSCTRMGLGLRHDLESLAYTVCFVLYGLCSSTSLRNDSRLLHLAETSWKSRGPTRIATTSTSESVNRQKSASKSTIVPEVDCAPEVDDELKNDVPIGIQAHYDSYDGMDLDCYNIQGSRDAELTLPSDLLED